MNEVVDAFAVAVVVVAMFALVGRAVISLSGK
jgi:hypothetical protein